MTELLRYALGALDDVAVVRQLTRDVAAEAGLAPLEQTKLATVASEACRSSSTNASPSEVAFSIERGPEPRMVVVVRSGLPSSPGPPGPGRHSSPHLDERILRGMVDELDVSTDPQGRLILRAVKQLRPLGAHAESDLKRRITAIRPARSAETLERHNSELADALTLLEAQSDELESANAQLKQMNGRLAEVNEELDLTNRGVLDLYRELERRADELSQANASLSATAAAHRQLAEQQTALAELGRLATGSRNAIDLARHLAATVRQALQVDVCAVLKSDPGSSRLRLVATDGFNYDHASAVVLAAASAKRVRAGNSLVGNPSTRRDAFPLAAPPDARSAAMVAIAGPLEPWGVIVAFDSVPKRFSSAETIFIEAVSSLFSSSVARTASEDAATHAALHDAMTGLPNRAELIRRLGLALAPRPQARHRRGDPDPPDQTAVIFVDLDGFKGVNDTLGHAAGDRVLIASAARLSACVRPADTLGRFGGDEFVMLSEVADEHAAAALAGRLLAALEPPILVEGSEVVVSGSAGFALSDPSIGADELMANADIAMYWAKRTPGPRVEAFRPEMRTAAEAEGRLHRELMRALERGQLRAVYQPIIDLAEGTVRGVEALVRWQHPELGDVAPSLTVATAERIGLISDLTSWMVGEAGRTVSEWNASHPDHNPLRLAVNFSPILLNDPDCIRKLELQAKEAGLSLSLLDIEVTESGIANPTPQILASIVGLRDGGVKLSVDDFGTGYSSLISLVNLPFDVLKVDRSFVALLDRGGDKVLVSAMIGIARGRGFETVGEGIETRDQLAALISAECNFGQGYLFAKTMERGELDRIGELEPTFATLVRDARRVVFGQLPALKRVPKASARAVRILVVDDNPDDLELLRVLLTSVGHEVVTLSDPAAFISTLKEVLPDLVLMDLRLRGTSGFELARKGGSLLTMPLVAVTGYPDWVVESEPGARLFTSVITKPVDPKELFSRIDGLVREHSVNRSA